MRKVIELLRYATDSSRAFGEVALANIYSFILLIIVYLFYWTFPQAKDLLVTLNQDSDWQVMLFFLSIGTLGLLSWYFPRFVYKENAEHLHSWRSFFENLEQHRKAHGDGMIHTESSYWRKAMPRLVGFLIILVASTGILNVAHEVDPKFFFGIKPSWVLIFALVVYLIMRVWKTIAYAILPRRFRVMMDLYKTTPDFRIIPFYRAFKDYSNIYEKASLAGFIRLRLAFLFDYDNLSDENKIKVELFNTFYRQRTQVVDKGQRAFTIVTAIILLLAGAILFYLRDMNNRDFSSLVYLFLSGIILSLFFLFFTVGRKSIQLIKNDKVITIFLLSSTLLISVLFLLISFVPSWSRAVNPLTCANLAFVFHLAILYLLRIWGVRMDVFIVTGIIVLIALISSWTAGNPHHEVAYVKDEIKTESRLTEETYLDHWLAKRQPAIDSFLQTHDTYPVLVVSAEGGGSRAAYWTAITHAYLQKNMPGYFDQHLFALTGASGGNTGNSTYYSMQTSGVPADSIQPYAADIFEQNFLSSSLTLLLGLDSWQNTFGISARPDRARQLVGEWSRALESIAGAKGLEEPYLSFWYNEGSSTPRDDARPLLVINTTHVQEGDHAVMTPIKLDPAFYQGMDLLDSIEVYHDNQSISLGTATLLNASFPYINSAGNVTGVGSFVDAGYFDNFGALTAEGLMKKLKAIRQAAPDSSIYKKLSFVSILVRNSTVQPGGPVSRSVSGQLVAPVSSIANIRGAVNKKHKWRLKQVADQYFEVNLSQAEVILPGQDKPVKPVVPLARYLSPLAVLAMDKSQDDQVKAGGSLVKIVELVK